MERLIICQISELRHLVISMHPRIEEYAYHIDGDSDDTATSGNDDKLMAMINSDPDTVVSLYATIDI